MRFQNIHCLTIDVLQRLAILERTNSDAIHRTWYYDGFKIAANKETALYPNFITFLRRHIAPQQSKVKKSCFSLCSAFGLH